MGKKLVFCDDLGRVTVVHHKPETLSKNQREKGYIVDYEEPKVPENSTYMLSPFVADGKLVWKKENRVLSNTDIRSIFKIKELACLRGEDSIKQEIYTQISNLDQVTISCPLFVDILDTMLELGCLTQERYNEICQ